jgi:hypothetical protein
MIKISHPRKVLKKPIDFHPCWGQTKIWDRLGLGLGMALHHLIQLLFSKC